MKRILILTTTLSTGGITSFTIPLVKELAKTHDVTLAYTVDTCDKLKQIPDNVRKVSYRAGSTKNTILYMLIHGWLHHALKIKTRNHGSVSPIASIQRVAFASAEVTRLPEELLEEYDIAISTAEFYCNDLIVSKIKAKKKVGWIHPDYKALHTDVTFDRRTLDALNLIVTVSESTRGSLLELIPDYKQKVIYLPNKIEAGRIWELSEQYPPEYEKLQEKKIIVTVCRIDNSSKRVDRIIAIAKKMRERCEHFHWFIVGDGPDAQMIQALIDKMGLSEHITMLGLRKNPYPYMRYADLFVLTSQYEGRPIVVDEAIALHCPVIVSEYRTATEQVKIEYGYIIHNTDELIVEDFISKLNWEKIAKKKNYLIENNILAKTANEFNDKISLILEL